MERAIQALAILSFFWPLIVVGGLFGGAVLIIVFFGAMSNLSWEDLKSRTGVRFIPILLVAVAIPSGLLAWGAYRLTFWACLLHTGWLLLWVGACGMELKQGRRSSAG